MNAQTQSISDPTRAAGARRGGLNWSWFRIVWAITAKDLWDALKNKNTLGALLSVLFMIAFYKYLPVLLAGERPNYLLVYDPGASSLGIALENGGAFEVVRYPTYDLLLAQLTEGDAPELGVVIPAEYDAIVASDGVPELEAHVMRWVTPQEAAGLKRALEAHILELTSVPAQVRLAAEPVQMRPDLNGYNVTPSIALLYSLIIIGVAFVPHLMIEEKRAKTLEALLVSPAGPGQVTVAKALTGLAYGLLTAGVTFAFFANAIAQWPLAVLTAAAGALFCVSVGLLFGALVENRQQLMIWSWTAILPMFAPVLVILLEELMPDTVVAVSRWLPTTAIFRMLHVACTDQGAFLLWGPWLGLLLLWTAPFLVAVTWLVRRADR